VAFFGALCSAKRKTETEVQTGNKVCEKGKALKKNEKGQVKTGRGNMKRRLKIFTQREKPGGKNYWEGEELGITKSKWGFGCFGGFGLGGVFWLFGGFCWGVFCGGWGGVGVLGGWGFYWFLWGGGFGVGLGWGGLCFFVWVGGGGVCAGWGFCGVFALVFLGGFGFGVGVSGLVGFFCV